MFNLLSEAVCIDEEAATVACEAIGRINDEEVADRVVSLSALKLREPTSSSSLRVNLIKKVEDSCVVIT